MDNQKLTVRLELTEPQRQKIKEVFGKEFEALEFDIEEMEQRIAPACGSGKHFPG